MLASPVRAWRSPHILRQAAGRVVRLSAAANDAAADAFAAADASLIAEARAATEAGDAAAARVAWAELEDLRARAARGGVGR